MAAVAIVQHGARGTAACTHSERVAARADGIAKAVACADCEGHGLACRDAELGINANLALVRIGVCCLLQNQCKEVQ